MTPPFTITPPIDVWESFHKAWTWAVGKPGYDKKKFLDLENHLLELARAEKESTK